MCVDDLRESGLAMSVERNSRNCSDAGLTCVAIVDYVVVVLLCVAEYGTHAYLWEVEELIRKLLLSSLIVVFDKTSPVQVAVAVFMCCIAHVLHATWKPYVDPVVYRLQHGFL
jgi:hypothetical protein